MRRWASLPVRFVAAAGSGLGFASGLIVLLYLLLVSHWLQWRLPFGEIFPDNLVAWRAVATEAEAQRLSNEVLLADNFMLAAQLSFESGQPVPSLDHPLNVKHGRAGQLALWQLDETALPLLAGRDILLVVEETALDLVERQPWLARLCELFERVHIVAERSYYNRKRFLFYRLPAKGPKYCDRPSFAYVEQPMRAARVSGTIEVRGWAFEDDFGVAGVEIRLNDQPAGWAEYGLPMPAVRQFFPGLSDPSEPQLGFRALLDTTQWPDGEYWLSVRTYARDGGVRDSRARRLTITKASDTGP